MEKIKVSDLARKMGLTVSQTLTKLEECGIKKSNASDLLEENEVKKVLKGSNVKVDLKGTEKKTGMHIIRRNIKVINTSGDKSEVEQITTDISGSIKKSHHTVNDGRGASKNYNKDGLGVVAPKKPYPQRPKFNGGRNNNVVITRNGKPVEAPKEEKKVEQQPVAKVEEVKKTAPVVNNEKPVENEKNTGRKNPQYNNQNQRNNYNNNGNNSNYAPRNKYDNNRPRNNYNNRNENSNNSGDRNNRPNGNYNRDRNNGYRQNGNNNGYRQNGGYRQNSSMNNTSYQVNKFMKQTAAAPVEQKETRDYSNTNIDKRKYENKQNEKKQEKLDKNKLREQHSRVATSRLKGLEVDSSSGMLDLYERESDFSRKSSKKKNKQKVQMNQTKIIPMTEVKLPEMMTVNEFAEAIKKQAAEVIKKLFALGIMATVNQEIDFDTAFLIAEEFGITAEKEVKVTEEDILFDDSEDDEKDLAPRPPIVVVMGHVDHGKTSLLDKIRSANVVSGEAGGITQHIGAYKVTCNGREICFLDTPGHEAFTAMRARGAQVTDIAIIVVAADDGIKPQTIEAIDHAKAAGVSIIVAINKIDKPTANVDKVKQELMNVGLVAEEWGGDTICVPISAMTGQGIDNLLEMILLVADMKDLKANPNKQAKGTVLEARLDKNTGVITSMLVQRGELNVGDTIVIGDVIGKVRAMKDDKGKKVKHAGPSTPVEIIGLSEVPHTGDVFYEVENEKVAKQLVQKKKAEQRLKLIHQSSKVTLDDLFGQIKKGQIKDLNIIIKADVQGSVEALKESLEKLSNDQVRVRILHASTGGVKESDVTLASVSNAIIIGFNVRPESQAQIQADKEKVDLRLYRVIYDAIEDVEKALKGMIPKKYKEVILGTAEVRRVFKITNVGIVAGCYVKSGKVVRNAMVRLVRDNIVIFEIKIDSLKREKDDVKEVSEGYECGIKLEKFSDIKEGDIFECFEMEEIKGE